MQQICVFCGSSPGTRPEYSAAAHALGQALVAQGIELVYGGASVGLMGIVARTVLEGGGRVTGIIPRLLAEKEVALTSLDDLRIVDSMHERKALMAELSDGFIALPGGIGTIEEFVEVLTWAQLGIHTKPCGLLNIAGYYDGLLGFFDHMLAEGFIRPACRSTILVEQDPLSLLAAMGSYRSPTEDKAAWALKLSNS
ncbi:TIGR00730 family Rossman fold protein [Trichlorobacter lovleyi]|uniref:LOG family protein n=1 Tax=Trichlorobacter lovleyi TaxID=313985 RepID=UPI0022403EF9|nr:TIGR00730 family Rossman fold protein [Trichlorobacter lovleyi]QOX77474.1 TIGR00730 family Rossman fold protein [Trichlorobacter lovleyi]